MATTPLNLSPSLIVPQHLIQRRFRPAAKGIPPTCAERNRMLQFVRHYVAEYSPVPPLPLAQLKEHADRVSGLLRCDSVFQEYIGVLINNEMWREALAAVPYNKRLLLLPKCLRVEDKCPAPFDHFGLLCTQCGLCSIQDLQAEAEKLGYAVLVAEGSAVVTSLIAAGKVEAIVGVSCLNVLERAFPYLESAAVPGLAIPLLQDDCADTTVDLDWVWDYIHLTSADQTRRLDLGALREEIDSWFSPGALDSLMGAPQGEAERIARQWLGRAGKRWRPFLTVAAFQALSARQELPRSIDVRKVAVAVECFHKASLVHDDIEDGDLERYGKQSLHAEFGVPVALNVGDLLIGEGYRLIADTDLPAAQKAKMLLVAGEGQRQLCIGQGAELGWMRLPHALTPSEVLEIFRRKTAPAFEVALQLGALCAEALAGQGPGGVNGPGFEEVCPVLRRYSEALGIAYQIRDDISDADICAPGNDFAGLRPSLLLALAYQASSGASREVLGSVWLPVQKGAPSAEQIHQVCRELKAGEQAQAFLETYKEEAIRSLSDVENPNLKGLLRRVMGRIFNDAPLEGWCKEFEHGEHERVVRDAPIRPVGR